ncbi:PAM68 family protein [Moorena producens JHB]|uniref:PAM68 family protein n=1 Tax=Moorena producens (strain JHB) TaxID=1454205 RepID=A0A1D9FVT3_MOOP1|nr:PAM68 family protein [Moorena producens]AOY79482.1 PAM68 family protein [Moorena producens JHB]
MSTEPSRERLPFEPRQKRRKNPKAQNSSTNPQSTPKEKPSKTTVKQDKTQDKKQDLPRAASNDSMTIPDVVSKRMVRRMAIMCGIPSFLGIATFVVSYLLITQVGVELPHVAVILVSMGCFGLGVLGLSYGVLSASWEEDIPGTFFGWQEFTTNLGRLTSAWRAANTKS